MHAEFQRKIEQLKQDYERQLKEKDKQMDKYVLPEKPRNSAKQRKSKRNQTALFNIENMKNSKENVD